MTIYPADENGKPDILKPIEGKGDALYAVRKLSPGDYFVVLHGVLRPVVCEEQSVTKRVAWFLDDVPKRTRVLKPRAESKPKKSAPVKV